MSGGVSHVDSFDPKPRLFADHGKEVIFDHPETRNRPGYEKIFLKRPDWKFTPRGQSGIEVSDLFPHIAESGRRHRLHSFDAYQPFESLQRHTGHAHGLLCVCTAQHRCLDELRAWDCQSEPALISGSRAADAVCGNSGLGIGLSARRASGHTSPSGA